MINVDTLMAKATKSVEFMYDKVATIQRYVEYEKSSGADGQRWEDIHTNVPCRLSSVKLDNSTQGAANEIRYDTKLFASSDVKILTGDRFTVGKLVNGLLTDTVQYESAKEPFKYVTHQEVYLIRKEFA